MSWKPRQRNKAVKFSNNHTPAFYDLLPVDLKSENYIVKFDTSRPTNRFLIIHRSVKKYYKDLQFSEKLDLYNTSIKFSNHNNLGDTVLTIPVGQWNIATTWKHSTAHFTALLYVPDKQVFINAFYRLYKLIPEWPSQRYVTPFWLPGSYNNYDNEQYIRSAILSTPNKKSRYENVLLKLQSVHIATTNDLTNINYRQPLSLKLVTSPNCPGLRGFKYDSEEEFSSILLVRFTDAMYDYAVESLNLKRHGCSLCLSLSGPFKLGRHTLTQGFIKMTEFSNRYHHILTDLSERSSEISDSDNENHLSDHSDEVQ